MPNVSLGGWESRIRKRASGLSVIGSVMEEVLRGLSDESAFAPSPMALNDWLIVVPTPEVNALLRLAGLDPGEISVLSAALDHAGSKVVLDDKAARREAHRLGIPCIGTVGLILDAHKLGHIASVKEALNDVRRAGLYISDSLFRIALEAAGE